MVTHTNTENARLDEPALKQIPNRKDVNDIVTLSFLCAMIVIAFMASFINSNKNSQHYIEQNFAGPLMGGRSVDPQPNEADKSKAVAEPQSPLQAYPHP